MLKFCAGRMLNQMSIARTLRHIESLKRWRDMAHADVEYESRQRDLENEVSVLDKIRGAG